MTMDARPDLGYKMQTTQQPCRTPPELLDANRLAVELEIAREARLEISVEMLEVREQVEQGEERIRDLEQQVQAWRERAEAAEQRGSPADQALAEAEKQIERLRLNHTAATSHLQEHETALIEARKRVQHLEDELRSTAMQAQELHEKVVRAEEALSASQQIQAAARETSTYQMQERAQLESERARELAFNREEVLRLQHKVDMQSQSIEQFRSMSERLTLEVRKNKDVIRKLKQAEQDRPESWNSRGQMPSRSSQYYG